MGTRIEAVFIKTVRMAELVEFYRTGLELGSFQPGDADTLGFQIDSVYFAIEQVSIHKPQSGSVTIWFRIDDMDATYNRFLTLGAEVHSPPLEIGREVIASLSDPDGNLFGLIANH